MTTTPLTIVTAIRDNISRVIAKIKQSFSGLSSISSETGSRFSSISAAVRDIAIGANGLTSSFSKLKSTLSRVATTATREVGRGQYPLLNSTMT